MTTPITKEAFAAMLNGREYGSEITHDECKLAEQSGLVVVFGYSDDNCELRGAFHDEVGCYDGGIFRVNRQGILTMPNRDERETLERFGVLSAFNSSGSDITAKWDSEGYSWTYETSIPHACFDILEDGEKYCRGIVFSVENISK